MKFYILASLIIFTLVITHNIRKGKRTKESEDKSFWERERIANSVRRKSLDNLDYIHIPMEELPITLCREQPEIAECLRMIQELSTQKIVNFTGYSNTDLKLEYGAPNITQLMEFDQNYTALAGTLQKWATLLYNEGYTEETRQILEFAVSTRTDVRASYDLLAEIYLADNTPERIDHLIETAQTLNSLNKKIILEHLNGKAHRS